MNNTNQAYQTFDKAVIQSAVDNYEQKRATVVEDMRVLSEDFIQDKVDNVVLKRFFGLQKKRVTREEVIAHYKNKSGGLLFYVCLNSLDNKHKDYYNVYVEFFDHYRDYFGESNTVDKRAEELSFLKSSVLNNVSDDNVSLNDNLSDFVVTYA